MRMSTAEDKHNSYWRVETVTGGSKQLLEGRNSYWRVETVTGGSKQLLEGRNSYSASHLKNPGERYIAHLNMQNNLGDF